MLPSSSYAVFSKTGLTDVPTCDNIQPIFGQQKKVLIEMIDYAVVVVVPVVLLISHKGAFGVGQGTT